MTWVLAPLTAVDWLTGEALTLAYVNKLCLRLSFLTGIAHYCNRGRVSLRPKGEVSGKSHSLAEACADCGSHLLVFSAVMFCEGYSCRTLRRSCVIIGCDSKLTLKIERAG
ncbi:Phosphoribosyl-AMP cyclohydrolase [Candidatus Hodgkinia cicadicola]|nr:Phosphoribosyl-AMP cyclohydrolase [Candidatus Hodgkinia cicadicola]